MAMLSLKALLAKWLLKFLFGTSRWNIKGRSQINKILTDGKSVIIASWHSHLLPTFMDLAGNQYYGLAGLHKDAELISKIGDKMGWKLLRGSSSDRGKKVYKEIVNVLASPGNVVALTPDGPQGPPKIPKPGTIRAAQKTGAVIIPAMGQSTRRWSFTNWDTFFVGKPFSRIEMIYGDPLVFLESDDFNVCENKLKQALDKLENEVEKRGHQ